MFWRGDHPAIYRSRAERRREKGLSADLLHQLRRTLGLELIGIGVQTLQRVYGPAAGAELVLHIGGELIEIFLRHSMYQWRCGYPGKICREQMKP